MHDMDAPRAAAHVRTYTDRKLLPCNQKNKGVMGFCLQGGDACVPYLSEQRVCDAVQPGGALVSQVVKDVEGTRRFRASLLVAKNKVNPLMQLTRHKLAFQGLSEDCRASGGEGDASSMWTGKKSNQKLYFTLQRAITASNVINPIKKCSWNSWFIMIINDIQLIKHKHFWQITNTSKM